VLLSDKLLDLFFVNEQFCGWALLNPARFVVDAWEEADRGDEDAQFVAHLSDYLTLLTDPSIEQMEDRDGPLLDALRNLYSRITLTYHPSKGYNALRCRAGDLTLLNYPSASKGGPTAMMPYFSST
jgi:hypothetical protein